ncbi:MAG: aminotransferase class III-fold pyridoxal phosphate-dependent enzyme [Ignavibacteriaceae bacterium]|nr:aminotransferase class III-fold pyridoxal phosphate-dependent enzyme [Ignavibacteriaceae bacterium]
MKTPNKIQFNPDYPGIKNSDELYNRAKNIIPSVTQTLAKGPSQYVFGIAPKFIQKGKGSHVWDVDGNEYIDYNMAIGPVSLGYSYPKVDEAIIQQLASGITFSMMHPLEVEVSEIISEIIPNAEAVRFSKTGADVTSAAIRLSRAFTGKNKVLCCGYHGWHDWYISVTDRNKGIPDQIKDLTFTFNYNDIESLINSIDDDTACVILEPFVFEEPQKNFLNELRTICSSKNIVLVFDEMWTGFRISTGGAQEYFGVTADLACFSKAIANGMPLSVLCGKKEIMSLLEKDVFFYTTFGGETLSLAAAKATITEMIEKNVPQYLSTQGSKLIKGLNQILFDFEIDYITCSGYNCRSIVNFSLKNGNSLELKSLMQQELFKRGILWSGFHNISFSHSDDDIKYTLDAYGDLMPIIKQAVDEGNISKFLKGKPVEPVFRKTGNFNIKPVSKKVIQ